MPIIFNTDLLNILPTILFIALRVHQTTKYAYTRPNCLFRDIDASHAYHVSSYIINNNVQVLLGSSYYYT